MSRAVFTFDATWFDREFRKALDGLDPAERKKFEADLAALIGALQECRHPTADTALASYKPTAYSVGVPGLYEYRLGPLQRVIAKCADVAAESEILLLTVTLTHDHPRMKGLIDAHKKQIKST